MEARSDLAREFDACMRQGVDTLAGLGYNATRFRQMLDRNGGVETARRLVLADAAEGLWRLKQMEHLHMSAEFWVLLPRYENLFDQPVRDQAHNKLRGMEFDVDAELRERG